jgi:hypothetical protein
MLSGKTTDILATIQIKYNVYLPVIDIIYIRNINMSHNIHVRNLLYTCKLSFLLNLTALQVSANRKNFSTEDSGRVTHVNDVISSHIVWAVWVYLFEAAGRGRTRARTVYFL